MRFAQKPTAFRKQILDMMTDEDKQYIIRLAEKRAKNDSNDEYNYCRNHSGKVVLANPDNLLLDIGCEIAETIFDRLFFTGRISEEDYDKIMYVREDELNGLLIYEKITGVKLRIWHNEAAAKRFVENGIEFEDNEDLYLDENGIPYDEIDSSRIVMPMDEILHMFGKKNISTKNMDRLVKLALQTLEEKEKQKFAQYVEEEAKKYNAKNVIFLNEEAFTMRIMQDYASLEKKSLARFFRLINEKNPENIEKNRKKFSNLFAIELYRVITGKSIELGEKEMPKKHATTQFR